MLPIADSSQGPIRVEVTVGDTVRVLTKHGDRPQFKVTQIQPDALVGDEVQISYDDMVFVERLTVSTAKTAGIGAMVVLVVVGGAVVAEDSLSGGWPSAP
jgi:hypothetical protein